jgi:hypothetical protein
MAAKAPPGVPKSAGKAGPPPRFLNKASGKMESAKAMKGYRAPAAQKTLNPSKTGPTHPAPAPVAKSWLEMNPAETHAYAAKQVGQNTQAELGPLKQKGTEISGTEGLVAGRYAGYGQQNLQGLQGLQSQAAEGAKTFNNSLADTVLKASKGVETTGQADQAANAGYQDPQVRAALAAQQGNIAATGAAAQTAGQASGQNEQNLLTTMKAAAEQRVREGQGNIASTYGKQRQANTNAENTLLLRQPGQVTKLETELGQKQFNAKATQAGLENKSLALVQKERETNARVGATVKGQEAATARNTANINQRETASERTAKTAEKDTTARLEAGAAKRGGSAAGSPAGSNKIFGELGSAAARVQALRSGKKPLTESAIREAISSGQFKEGYQAKNAKTGKVESKVRINKQKAIGNQVIVNAALEAWNTQKISPETRRQLEAQGYKPGTDEEVVNELFGPGHIKNPALQGVSGGVQAGTKK